MFGNLTALDPTPSLTRAYGPTRSALNPLLHRSGAHSPELPTVDTPWDPGWPIRGVPIQRGFHQGFENLVAIGVGDSPFRNNPHDIVREPLDNLDHRSLLCSTSRCT